MTLVTGARPPKLEALDRGGNSIDAAAAHGGLPEVVTLTGPNIAAVRITAPQDETVVLRVCWTCEKKLPGNDRRMVTVKGFEPSIDEALGAANEFFDHLDIQAAAPESTD